jgi:CrcB protein
LLVTTSEPATVHHGITAALVAAGGTVGTAARAGVSHAVPHLGGVPVGILAINLAGAYLLGLLLEVLTRLGPDTGRRRHLRLLLGTGVLGGFTTYSALAVDTASLLDTSRILAGAGYALITVAVGGLASWAGIVTGRAVRPRPGGQSRHAGPAS